MNEREADTAIFKEPGFLIALALSCSVLIGIGVFFLYAM
jgi:hypothetical protein